MINKVVFLTRFAEKTTLIRDLKNVEPRGEQIRNRTFRRMSCCS